MKKGIEENKIIIYQAKNGAIELRGDFNKETIWATQSQIAQLFDVTSQNVTLHIKNIFKENELDPTATCKESLQVQIEGNRRIERNIKFYNLDVIIAVGYRINSIMGTNFRIWATKTLREHITKGFTINKKQISKNYDAFMKSVSDIQLLLPEHIVLDPKTVLELIKEFANTWVSIDAYDKETLNLVGTTKKSIKLDGLELVQIIKSFRIELMKKGEVSELFAQERKEGSVEGIVGNVMQSFAGKTLYRTVEEKAAHLLYFMVKNHPFIDGNKRSGAFAFIWFLRKFKVKKMRNINPSALTALTLLIAESNPNKKDQMVALVTQILK